MEALGRVFRVTLELLAAYKEQVAGEPLLLSILKWNWSTQIPDASWEIEFLIFHLSFDRNCERGGSRGGR